MKLFLEKKGQMYLLASIVIISVIGSGLLVNTYFNSKNYSIIYHLGDQLETESFEVLNYGTYNSEDVNMGDMMKNFTEDFSNYSRKSGREIYFLFGDQEKIVLVNYDPENNGENVSIRSGKVLEGFQKEHYPVKGQQEVIVNIGGIDYIFELKRWEIFYFIISEEINGEKYVIKSEY